MMDVDIGSLLEEPKRETTARKTERDVLYFQQYLRESEAVYVPMKDLPEDQLVKCMCSFFAGVKKKANGEDYEPTTLWSKYASLKRHLTEVKYNFEGSRHITVALAPVTKVLQVVSKQLKEKGKGRLPNASDAVSYSEVRKLYADKIAGRHSPLALNNAMVINLMFLGFRGSSELYNRKLGDLKIVTVDGKKELHIAIKTRSGEDPKATSFGLPALAATGDLDCPVKAFEELKKRRPPNFMDDDSPMFMRPSFSDPRYTPLAGKAWYFNSRVGINYISKMTSKMMLELDVDITGRRITNTSCRKSMAAALLKMKYSSKSLMRQLQHDTNPVSMLRYDEADAPTDQIAGEIFGDPHEQPCSSKDGIAIKQEPPEVWYPAEEPVPYDFETM